MGRSEGSRFAKSRVDALSDGVFAFSMTLLVLDIRLPDDLAVASAAELAAHLVSLWDRTLTYVISFFVLGSFWRSSIELRPSGEDADRRVVNLVLVMLLFVTAVPFSSGLVGRYGQFLPAILVYAANMAVLGVLTIAMRYLDVRPDKRSLATAAGGRLPTFLVSALLSVLIALLAPRYAMYAYLLNFLTRLPFWPGRGFEGRT